MKSIFITIFLVFNFIHLCYSQTVQFRGPERSGSYPDSKLLTSWPDNGPEVLLHLKGFGSGHSSPVIYNEKIYISGKKDDNDVLSAFSMDGELIWEKAYGNAWHASYPDSRHTATIHDNRIYVSSGMGEVVCMDAGNGKIIWKKNPHEDFEGKFGTWGLAESVLLTDEAVIVSVGGEKASVVALKKENGELFWKTPPTGDQRSYVSPMMIDRNGQKIILAVLSDHMLGIDPGNGNLLWKFNLLGEYVKNAGRNNRISANTPLYKDGEIFLTSGYNATSVMLTLSADGRSVSLKWTDDVLDTHHGGVVKVDGYIYGSNWINNNQGNWVCLDWETGKVMYEKEWHNKGQIIYADGHLYCKEERDGNVALVHATPSGFNIVSEFNIEMGSRPFWSHPMIHKGKLLIRQGDELKIYNISK